jgi:hypothetical protein
MARRLSFRHMQTLMIRKNPLILWLAAFFGFFSLPVNAQVNLKAGYNISFLSDPGVNQVIGLFSESQPYTSSFDKFSWLHGFEGGLRFKGGPHALEITYQIGYQQLKAKGDANGGTSPYLDKIWLAVHSGGIGYQATGELFGAGVDLQYQWYRTRVELENAETKFKDIQKMLGMKFYLMFTLKGSGNIDAVLQPYYILPFDSYNPDPLSQFLNQVPGPESKKWARFGLSVLFYNGRK